MGRKYLDDIGVTKECYMFSTDDPRQPIWDKEKEEYGFDARETWALDFTFYCWLYERLKMFLNVNCINLEFHKFEYEGEELTQQECIDRMLKGCEVFFKNDNDWTSPEEDQKMINDVAKMPVKALGVHHLILGNK